MNYVKIEGHNGYVRDKKSGAVLNTNKSEIEAAKKRKQQRATKEQELDNLKNEVSDIKIMLTKLIEKLDG
jgi:hypothetical protein|tara:strand:- start:614 stop:823 length:210 start_codon:yes stop_codon:yes gene_type:complete